MSTNAPKPRSSYTVHHVLDESSSFELCSDDLVAAQALEEADNNSRAVSGYYVTSHETDRYFEFVRELAYTQDVGNIGDVTSPGFARIFKCDHTNRRRRRSQLAERLFRPHQSARLDAGTLRVFTEYLWQFRFFNTTHKKVISSFGSGQPSDLRHTLLLAFVHNQGQDSCDRIDVVEWRFSADTASGEVTREFEDRAQLRGDRVRRNSYPLPISRRSTRRDTANLHMAQYRYSHTAKLRWTGIIAEETLGSHRQNSPPQRPSAETSQ